MNLPELKQLLKENRIFLSEKLDQHFLVDREILTREVNYAGITSEDTILEIGPGAGTLTELLAKKAKKVIVIEKDEKLKPLLERIPNIEIIIGDAMKVEWPECNKILSNVPYSISSALTFKILKQPIELAVLCFQKEFAARMAARAGEQKYSRLSVNTSVRATVELMEDVPKEKYFPVPKVNSTIVRLTPKEFDEPEHFDSLVRTLFQHKNQKVRNALLHSYKELGTKEKMEQFVDALGDIGQQRVIVLKPEDIIRLSKSWQENQGITQTGR